MSIVLGIDGGGSSTRAVLAREDGTVLGRGAAGPSNIQSVGVEAAASALGAAVVMAWERAGVRRRPADAAVLGLAGVTSSQIRVKAADLGRRLGLAERIRVEHDLHIALIGGLGGGPGTVLIAGTGASCYARNGMGKNALVGGKGALAGDSGSAYWIGHRALRVAAKQIDGRLARTDLLQTVLSFLEVTAPEDFASRAGALRTWELARLCPRIVELSQEGEKASCSIIAGAELALVEMVRTATSRVGLERPDVILTGGLARSAGFADGLRNAIKNRVPGANFPDRLLSPVGGAVLEAIEDLGIGSVEAALKGLQASLSDG
jgi:N-acetylglucosamine kinase-like BadF-type ATPase